MPETVVADVGHAGRIVRPEPPHAVGDCISTHRIRLIGGTRRIVSIRRVTVIVRRLRCDDSAQDHPTDDTGRYRTPVIANLNRRRRFIELRRQNDCAGRAA